MTPSELFLRNEYSNSLFVMFFPLIFMITGSAVCATADNPIIREAPKIAIFFIVSFAVIY